MLYIREFVDVEELSTVISEAESGKSKEYRIEGPYIQAEVKNKNGRVYPKNIVEREVNVFNKEKIKANRALGELDHPPTPTVNLKNVSHVIESLVMEGNNGIGKAKILDTVSGRTASSLLEAGVKLGVSTRGVGSLNGSQVNPDFKLITVDLVADPSAPNAFVEGIMEGREWIIDGDKIVEKAVEKLEENLSKHGSREILEDLQDFIKDIQA